MHRTETERSSGNVPLHHDEKQKEHPRPSDKTGAYMFKEGIIPNDQVKEFFEEKK